MTQSSSEPRRSVLWGRAPYGTPPISAEGEARQQARKQWQAAAGVFPPMGTAHVGAQGTDKWSECPEMEVKTTLSCTDFELWLLLTQSCWVPPAAGSLCSHTPRLSQLPLGARTAETEPPSTDSKTQLFPWAPGHSGPFPILATLRHSAHTALPPSILHCTPRFWSVFQDQALQGNPGDGCSFGALVGRTSHCPL